MLQKLRSRHPVDLPYGKWGIAKPILMVLAGIAVLFVIIPLLLSPLAAASVSIRKVLVLLVASLGTLVLVLVVAGIRGKYGWQR